MKRMDGFLILRRLEKADLSKVKLMWVNYPHMPTGTKGSDKPVSRNLFPLLSDIIFCCAMTILTALS